jgi:hypothetical protein
MLVSVMPGTTLYKWLGNEFRCDALIVQPMLC